MAAPATQEHVDRLGELLGETATMKKAEVLEALAELGVDVSHEAIADQPLGNLRGTLAAVRLDRERRDAGTDEDPAGSRDVPAEEPEVVEADAVEVEPELVVPPEVEAEVGNAIELRRESPPPTSALPSPDEWKAVLTIATELCDTEFVPELYRGKREAVAAAILVGRELGVGPMQSLRDIHMIDGRPAFSANLLLGQLRKGGIVIEESSSTAERAYIRARRRDTGELADVEWTIEEAQTAGLLGKKNWRGYPADMLWARAVGRLARRLGSDLIAGLPYAAEEVRDWQDEPEPGSRTPAPGGRSVPVRETTGPEKLDPKGWGEIFAAAEPYGPTLGWAEWTKDAMRLLYNTDDRSKLTPDQMQELGKKAAAAIVALHDAHEPGLFPPPTRDEVAAAWAASLNGAILPGPMWQMSPGEAELDLPTVYDALGIEPPSAPESPPEASATETPRETPEGASGPEDEPETVPDGEWSDAADGIDF